MTPATCPECDDLREMMRGALSFETKAQIKLALDAHKKAMHGEQNDRTQPEPKNDNRG